MNPLFSIIIPCYNQAHFLPQCLDSLLEQEFKNWEAIVVNDGSTDSSEKLIKVFMKNCKNDVQYFFTEHKGLPFCLNFGISHAQGKYIA